jgi:hypothetical protein
VTGQPETETGRHSSVGKNVAVGSAVNVGGGSVSPAGVGWEVGAGCSGDPARESPGFVAGTAGPVSSAEEGPAGRLSDWMVASGRSFAASGGLLHEATKIKIRITDNQQLTRLGKFSFITSFSTPSFSPLEFLVYLYTPLEFGRFHPIVWSLITDLTAMTPGARR